MSRVATILSITVFAIAFAPIANSADSTTVSTDHAAGTTTTTVHTTTVHHHHSHHHFHPVNRHPKLSIIRFMRLPRPFMMLRARNRKGPNHSTSP